jgi:hypothetical protein
MKKLELRAEARIPVSRRASLNSGDAWFPCLVMDMSDSGFLIMCTKELAAGQVLEFRCELFPEKYLECKIEIKHIGDTSVGTKITEIDEKGTKLCQLFLQEQYSDKLNKFG